MQVLPSDSDDRGGVVALSQSTGYRETVTEVVCPIAVCCLGVGVSLLALGPLIGNLFKTKSNI